MTTFKKLKNHPLVCVLTEVRFSSVLNLDKYIPEIQDKVRFLYPIYKKDTEQAVNVTHSGIQVENLESHIFQSKDKRSSFIISTDRLLLITSDYNRFDDFSEKFKQILTVVSEVVSPSLYSRIGIRYADCIKLEPNNFNEEQLNKLLDNKEVFFHESLSTLGNKVNHRTDTTLETKYGTLLFRSLNGLTNAVAFEDLTTQPYIQLKNDGEASIRVLLDFDHFWQHNEDPKDFVVENMLSHLEKLHTLSRQAFWNITSEYARGNVWA